MCRVGAVRTCTHRICPFFMFWSSQRMRRSIREGRGWLGLSRNTLRRSCCKGRRPKNRRESRGNKNVRVRGRVQGDPNLLFQPECLISRMNWVNFSKNPLKTIWKTLKKLWLNRTRLTASAPLSNLKLPKKNNYFELSLTYRNITKINRMKLQEMKLKLIEPQDRLRNSLMSKHK